MQLTNLRLEMVGADIAVVTLDMPGRPFNVFSDDMIDELEKLVVHLEEHAEDIRGVVVTSGKDAFMAGADLAMVEGFTTLRHRASNDEIRRTFSRLSYLMRRIERLPQTAVAAVNGLALGGGLELAMACHHRVAAAGDTPCLGLPEVLLGLLPGAGGTQRLPRLTTPAFAAPMLLDGKPVTPAAALAAGLVDRVVPAAELVDSACAMARELSAGARWDQPGWQEPADAEGVLAGEDAEQRLLGLGWADERVLHCYPAFRAIARCLLDGRDKDFDAAMEVEFDNFHTLMVDPVAGNMVNTGFLAKTAAPKRARDAAGAAQSKPRRVAIECDDDVPARLAGRFEVVDGNSADVHFGLRRLPDGRASGCAVEMRYAGDCNRAQGVEIAGAPGEPVAGTVAVAARAGLVPVVVAANEPGPAARLLAVVREWTMAAGTDEAQRARIATAVDGAGLFAAAGFETVPADDFSEGDRAAGLALLSLVAAEAAACLREGLVTAAQDIDVLAVFVLGFPAWTGGPLRFLDDVSRGDIAGAHASAQDSAESFYPLP